MKLPEDGLRCLKQAFSLGVAETVNTAQQTDQTVHDGSALVGLDDGQSLEQHLPQELTKRLRGTFVIQLLENGSQLRLGRQQSLKFVVEQTIV